MALKKPSDFFGKKPEDKETLVFTEEVLPEKFDAYKNNLNNIEVLKEFTDNFGSFSENIARVQALEETIVELREEISSTLSKEDLDNAMMSNLLILEENVDKIQKSLKGINRKDLKEIYENVEEISNQVLYVVEELPRHKSLIKSQEVSFDKRLQGYQQSIDEQLTEFNEYLALRLSDLSIQQQEDTEYLKATLEGINQQSLDEITSSVRDIQTEVPKYKNSINKKFAEFTEKVGSYQNQISEKLEEVQNSFLNLVEEELPKYQSLLTQSKIENDEKFERISHKLSEEIENLTEQNQKLNIELEEKSSSLEQSFLNKISEFEKTLSSSKQTLEETNQTYKDVYRAIETKGLKDQGRFDEQEQLISNLNNEISVVLEQISETKTEIQQLDYVTSKELSEAQKQFQKKLNLIENDIQHQSSKLKSENQSLTETVLSLQKEFQQLPEELNENYYHLTKKITHLETIFEKFNEKTILTEELVNPSEKNSDPLTPTNQKFVTLEQLQEHYRLFINRVQQQLASIGGGGETRLEFLDDVDRSSAKTDGYVLAYQASTGKFIGTEVSTSGISTYADVAGISTVSQGLTGTPNISVSSLTATDGSFSGIVTASNSAVVQTGTATTALIVEGDARVTGILTVGTSSITLDGDTNQVNVGTGVTLHHTNGVQVGGNTLHTSGLTLNHFNVSGISTISQLDISNGINVSGVITATDAIFSGNVSVAGTITYEDVTNVDSIGIITARNSAVIKAGTATTALLVEGDTRIVGILTIGTSSITLDGDVNQVNVGTGVTIHHTNGVQVGGNTLHTSGLTLNHVTISGISTISQLEISTDLNISGVVTSTSYVLPDGLVSSGITTTSTFSETVIDSFSASSYRTAKYQVQITRGSEYQATEIFLIHDGTTTYQTEYAVISTGSVLGTFNADISEGNVRLLVTPSSSESTTFKLIKTLVKV